MIIANSIPKLTLAGLFICDKLGDRAKQNKTRPLKLRKSLFNVGCSVHSSHLLAGVFTTPYVTADKSENNDYEIFNLAFGESIHNRACLKRAHRGDFTCIICVCVR